VAVKPVVLSPVVVACEAGGGGAAIPVDISPAKADRANTKVNTNVAQSRRKGLIFVVLKGFPCSLAKVFLLLLGSDRR
jgi:invasion protein IalB